MMKATWSRSFKAITAGWAAASSCRNSDSCFKIAANCFRWNRDTRTFTQRELKKRGHDVRVDVGGYGGYQAIKVEMHDGQRVYVGASESRKDGQAAGY